MTVCVFLAALAVPAPVAIAATAPVAIGPVVVAADDGPDLEKEVDWLGRMMRKRRLGSRDPERITGRIEALEEGDLAWVAARLAEVPADDRGDAAPEVLRMARDRVLVLRFGAGVLALPDAWKRFAAATPADQGRLLADLSRLEDMEPCVRFGLWAIQGSDLSVRLRAVDALADALTFGGDAERILPALRKALDDPSPAVVDLALERLIDHSDAPVLDWCLAHVVDDASVTTEVRGKERVCRPGDRAWVLLTELSRSRMALDPRDFRAKPEADRDAILGELRAWRASAGPNPLRDRGDGPFDPLPKTTTAWVDPRHPDRASVRWWSEVDRAQFRMDLTEIDVVASSELDWNATFRLYVVASGARQGSWEAYARRVRCGMSHRLGRKGFALIETSVQHLLDGRLRILVRAYESL